MQTITAAGYTDKTCCRHIQTEPLVERHRQSLLQRYTDINCSRIFRQNLLQRYACRACCRGTHIWYSYRICSRDIPTEPDSEVYR
jgi:hypothetical protein